MLKKALEEGGNDILEVVVDNPAARENVSRFAARSGCAVLSVQEEQGIFTLSMSPGTKGGAIAHPVQGNEADQEARPMEATTCDAEGAAGATVLVASDRLGRGADELGALLLKGFIYALAEADVAPRRIVFMNSGVRVSTEGSVSLPDLARLSGRGVEILSCGTCLDYYGVKDKLAVGRISNMYEIAGFLLEGRTLAI
jgi:selenium metabolism protein YedF